MDYLNKAYLLIGGNVGNKLSNLAKAIELLQKRCGQVVKKSSIYETAPWGFREQDSFLNQAIELHTTYNASDLMRQLLAIEAKMGRIRAEKNGPRIIDLDILLFNDDIINAPDLIVPHKELQNRRFVLEPLLEIAPSLIHPVFEKSIGQLLEECHDQSDVKKLMN